MPKKIFITGASGCIGHYIANILIEQTDHELYFLIRYPQKLKFNYQKRPGIHIINSDLREIEKHTDLLRQMNGVILAATAWGGTKEVFDTNVVKTLSLIKLLDPNICEQVLYFSTASILDRQNQLLKEAGQLGTDYIRSKYELMWELKRLTKSLPLVCLYPTLVLGGDDHHPYSHLSGGLPDLVKYVSLLRWLKAEGSFHFIHAADIAQVVYHLIEHPPVSNSMQHLVLGNQAITANQAIAQACEYLGKRIYLQLNLSDWLIESIIVAFQIKMATWDRFCLDYRHFTYTNPVNP
ncbi:MAG: NAD-dependent epimerase/dehydratase family protein, partial [Microcoleaceae cyanobacterium]